MVSHCLTSITDKHTKYADIPPLWHLPVPGHQASVHIWLLVQGAASLDPDLLSEVEYGVHKGGRDARKTHCVGHRKGRAVNRF